MTAGRLRTRTWEGDAVPDAATRMVMPLGLALVIGVVLLVTTKAF